MLFQGEAHTNDICADAWWHLHDSHQAESLLPGLCLLTCTHHLVVSEEQWYLLTFRILSHLQCTKHRKSFSPAKSQYYNSHHQDNSTTCTFCPRELVQASTHPKLDVLKAKCWRWQCPAGHSSCKSPGSFWEQAATFRSSSNWPIQHSKIQNLASDLSPPFPHAHYTLPSINLAEKVFG